MSTDLVRRSNDATREWVELMAPAVELAKSVSATEFVPKGLRNNPPAIVAAILYGDEIGLGPMQALAKIAMIEGRPSIAAETQRALVLRRGHEMWIKEATNSRVTICGRRKGSDQVSEVTWTLDDAKRAKLDGKQNWRAYPRAMLIARASAELARTVFPDALGGLAATEELLEAVELNGDAPAVSSAATGTKRKRRDNPSVESGGALPSSDVLPPPMPDLPEIAPAQDPPTEAGDDEPEPLTVLSGEGVVEREEAPAVAAALPEPPSTLAAEIDAEIAAEKAAKIISDAQRTRLWTLISTRAVPHERVREIVLEVTGDESTKTIPRELYDAVYASIQAEPVGE